MITSFSTTRRKLTGICWPLFALAVLAAPSLAWAQVCNDSGSINKAPDLGLYNLGDKIRVTYSFGAADLTAGTRLTVNPAANGQVLVGLDCKTALLSGDREKCLGIDGDGVLQNDGTAITYADNVASGNIGAGNACTGLVFTAIGHGDGDPPEASPNIVTFQANGPIIFDPNESCFISFDVVLHDIGLQANWEPSTSQLVNQAAGFTGACSGTLGASSTKSAAYTIEIIPDIALRKEVSINGGTTWFDANVGPFPIGFVPGTTALYRLIAENIGEEALENVVLNDPTLGLVDVPLPARCYTSGLFPVGGTCTIVSGDSGFGALGTPPVAICLTAGTKTNIACVDGEGGATGLPVQACDPANVVCVEPGIDVTKDGPPLAKVGDAIEYEICAENTGGVDLANCKVTDTRLGLSSANFRADAMPLVPAEKVCANYPYTVLSGDPDPLPNTATVTCDVVGAGTTISDNDNHSVNLFQPSINVTKDGPDEAKVGDEVCYDIGFTDTSSADTPPLVNCTGTDTLLDITAAVFEDGVTQEFCRTALASDPNPLLNEAEITCQLDGYDNGLPAPDSARHSVTLFEVGAILTKDCAPDTLITVPDPISWEICVENTGDKDIECTINDTTAGITAEVVSVAVGATNCDTTATRPTTSADVPTVTNTATAVCTVPGYDNLVPTDPATDTCTVRQDTDEICRTPGFWGTHAGEEKVGRSTNLTQEVIDYNGGSLGVICGRTITNTLLRDYGSAQEGICVHPKGLIVRQLARQLIAAALNCVVSGGDADCTGVSIDADFDLANAACTSGQGDLSYWVGIIDDFNNGVDSDCHERKLTESDVFDDVAYKVPGAAGSSNACNAAVSNDFFLVP